MEEKYILTQDIIIPSGTILNIAPNNKGGKYYRHCFVEIGRDFTGDFLITKDCAVSDSNGIIIKLT